MEKTNDGVELLAEVTRLQAELDDREQTELVKRLREQNERLHRASLNYIHDRDQYKRERDDAKAEVERLKAELDQQSPAAPQPAAPPAGWLTDEEREHLGLAAHFLRRYGLSIGAQTIEGILSRAGSPPVVEVPAMNGVTAARVEARAYRAAMDKAGVKWKEVWRE